MSPPPGLEREEELLDIEEELLEREEELLEREEELVVPFTGGNSSSGSSSQQGKVGWYMVAWQ